MTPLETIVAPATPPGRSALAIVRIDGPDAAAILTAFTRSGLPSVRHAALVKLYEVDGDDEHPLMTDAVIDECIAIRYEAPHSFTGNDLVELTLHGNPLLVSRVIEACVARGARLAQPGELTERAVLNGKLDLVQAESIADLINARTALQAKLSLANLEGTLSRSTVAIRETLLEVIARLEAALDFSEEGYDFITRGEVRRRLAGALHEVDSMRETYRRGAATRAGLTAVILGRPNAGKSTLLNRLVGSDRAIVTPVPGTTRDIVRETIVIGGLPVTLADTAGLRDSSDVVERIGIARAREAARTADITLYLVDATSGWTSEDQAELALLERVIVVATKLDAAEAGRDPGRPVDVAISAVSGAGIAELLRLLDQRVQQDFAATEGALVNERQLAAVSECADALRAALASAEAEEQMILVDLYRAANALGTLTGAITRDEILSEIFGKFCIGK